MFATFRNLFWNLGRKYYPSLNSFNKSIPSRSSQRINMDIASRPLRPHEKPTIRRTLSFTDKVEKIICKVKRGFIVVYHTLENGVFIKTRCKHIQWAIIPM